MREPQARGSAADDERYAEWLSRFAGYRVAVTKERIANWLNQFDDDHADMAARVLDCVEYYGTEDIESACKRALAQLPGWHKEAGKRTGDWRFVPFSVSPGTSSDVMIAKFRTATRMTGRSYNSLFGYASSLLSSGLGEGDSIVFVDDFSGSGDQATGRWQHSIVEILPEGPRVYLLLVAATETARQRVADETGMELIAEFTLGKEDDVFSNDCPHFTASEKQALGEYCVKANRKEPRGYKECGLLAVFAHKTPNNSIAVLHADTAKWAGLFPRI